MSSYPLPANEHERLAALSSYNILDTGAEQDFDDLARLASVICGTPIALITLVDKSRQWFKSRTGIDIPETDRKLSFCTHTILSDDIMIVNDAKLDSRFVNNEMVTGPSKVTFYAGVPLINADGYALGTLCVVDHKAKTLTDEQISLLKALTRQVMDKLELRRKIDEIGRLNNQLKENEQRAMHLIQDAPIAIGVLRGDKFTIESANEQLLEIWGKTKNIIGKPLEVALPELRGQSFLKILDDVYVSGKAYYGNEAKTAIERNGKKGHYYFNFVYHPLKNYKGNIDGIMVVATDVTEQIEARTIIEYNEHKLHRMVMTTPMGMTVLKGRELVIEIANQPMLQIWNRAEVDVLGKRLLEVFPELLDQPFPDMLYSIFDTGKPIAINESIAKVANKDGSVNEYYLNFTYDPLYDMNGYVEAVLVALIDITEIVRTREELSSTKETLRLAIDTAQLGVWSYDREESELALSDRTKELLGLHYNETITLQEALDMMLPEHREKVAAAIARTINKGDDIDIEYQMHTRNSGQLVWLHATGKAVADADRKITKVIGTVIEITARKLDEQRKNDFIAMVSHELKTPLTSIKGYAQLLALKAKTINDGQFVNTLDRVSFQVNKMQSMINGFLNVSRLEAGRLHLDISKFNLNSLITQTIAEVMFATSGYNIEFNDCIEVDIKADKNKIGQVLENLLSNAVKYSSPEHTIVVNCELSNTEVKISISDNGIGIMPKDIDKIFERFYRVDNPGIKTVSGFGIGLYLSAEIIQLHKGRIWAESEYGKGSTFSFILPV